MQYLLDTNTCIAAMRRNTHVAARLQRLSPSDCAVSTISVFELLTGVKKCRNPIDEEAKVRLFLSYIAVLDFDANAALNSAMIRSTLEAQGTPIGPYDMLLAGQAMSRRLTFVTNNLNEFSRIAGLPLEDWSVPNS